MIPTSTPERVRRAHDCIVPIFDFLAQYESWMANPKPTDCDFALGNPQTMPLPGFVTALREATAPQNPGWYAYKMSEPSSREIVRESLLRLTGQSYAPEDIFLTNGATGAVMVTMNALLGAGDEVIYSSPPWFFYEGMILNSGGKPVPVPVQADTFDLDLDAITAAITERTRFVIVNSPNNPTGKVYTRDTLEKLAAILEEASRRIGRVIYLVSDEVYRTIVYDGRQYVSPTTLYRNSIMIYSYGKTLLTPGQRLGYLALSPGIEERLALRDVMASSQILCGWAMSSALMQHALYRLEALSLDVDELQARRDRFVAGLRDGGYEVQAPEGAFYITPKTPIDDDARFAMELAKEGVYCLPGHVAKMPGYLRVSVTASDEMIERALPKFADVHRRLAG
ncbi:MAG: aminotransferase class I/II-fold pyridoxal phosphate-dependent enzyme [Planctomycetota bacterium]|nr:aminotransferase class I/II-fold pyridoxal phosphate-dependent enzyme [Planctomycetota bacterium]